MNEKRFTSCFVGIPLPEKFQEDFEALQESIHKIDPSLEIAYGETPHLTVYYMDEQSQNSLSEITEIIRGRRGMLNDTNLTIGGMDTFGEELPRVLFLPITFPPNLLDFNQVLRTDLKKFITFDDELPLHPHMTVARFWSKESKQNWSDVKDRIRTEMNRIHWQFPITEVVIYGVDSTKSPQYQEKLMIIPI